MADKLDRVAKRLIWEAGARARQEQGKTHLDNPHPVASEEYEWWLLGWTGRKHPAVKT